MVGNGYGHGGYKTVVVASVLILMQFLMGFGRYYSRRLQKVMLEADDYVLLLATLVTFALCAMGITFPKIAGTITSTGAVAGESEAEVKLMQASFISWQALYGASVALSKCAILLLYLRVFTTSKKKFTVAACLIGFVVVATGIATVIGSILQCTPMAHNWDSRKPGTCIDKLQFARYTATPNVVTGFAMLLLPLPMVWRLNVTLQQRVALTATFLHGIIGFIASIARLAILFQSGRTRDTNAMAISWTIWTMVEPANYVIAACLPSMRSIFVRILPPSFFLLTYKRRSKPYSSIKFSWPRGRVVPKISLVSSDVHGPSHLTGPWDNTRIYRKDLEANSGTSKDEQEEKAFVEGAGEASPSSNSI